MALGEPRVDTYCRPYLIHSARRRSRVGRPANEILDDLEQEWAPRLRAVSLAAELQLDAKLVRRAAKCIGLVYASRQHDAYRREQRLKRYPASLVLALSGVGALEYSSGTYWSAVWDATGLAGDAAMQAELGALYRHSLNRFGCPAFEHLPLKNVGPILLHAGIPRYSLGELVDIAIRRVDADSELDGPRFVQWATAAGRSSRIQALDKPAQRFLTEGGEFAEDWIDRLLDLLDRLRDPAPDLDGVRLPEWVVDHVRQLLVDKPPRETRRRSEGTRSTDPPRLALDPYGLGVHLVLPPVGNQPDGTATWQIALDGVTTVVRSRSLWPGASESAPGTTVALSRPIRSASITLGNSALSVDLDVVTPADPLLVFDDAGRRLPAALPLPPEPVWVLYPEAEAALDVRGEAPSLGTGPAPYGWEGWRLERLDLARVTRLRGGEGAWRSVRGSSRARLELARPVTGVSTAYGSLVYASAPHLLLPGTAGVQVSWSVVIRRPGGKPLLARDIETEEELNVDAFVDVPRPLVGPYQVVVRGPLGRGLSREIEMVEGLLVAADPPWREFVGNGLARCQVKASAADGVAVKPDSAMLESAQTGLHLEVSGAGCTEVLRLVVPHMAVQVLREGGTGSWSAGPVLLASEHLRDVDAMAIRLPAQITTGNVVFVQRSDVQSTALSAAAGNVARVDVRRFADTVGESGTGRLELELVGRRMPLASIRPRRLAGEAALTDYGELEFADCADSEGLVAGVYTVFQPWREPVELSVLAGRAGPDVRFAGRGPVLIHLRIEDPWLPSAWPEWPPSENRFRCEQDLRPRSGGWEDDVAAWLSAGSPVPSDPDALGALLLVYGLCDGLREAGVSVDVREGVAGAVRAAPLSDLLDAISTTRASSAVITPALVQGGAVYADYGDQNASDLLWLRSTLAAVLGVSGRLRGRDDMAREALCHAAGPLAGTLLGGGVDPFAGAGRFGQDALQFAALPREVLDQVWRAAGIVPSYMLDADSRVTAARQLFDARSRPGVRRIAAHAKHVADRLAEAAERRLPGASAAVGARASAHGWQSLPAMSLALALCGRLAAHGDVSLTDLLDEHVATWSALARHAPDLVELDLVLAECLVIGASR